MNSILNVFLNAELVGKLEQNDAGTMSFSYDEKATRQISIGMPLSQPYFDNEHCEAFFGNLLPDGDEARKALGKKFGVSPNNTFSLLNALGAECAGALTILSADKQAPIEEPENIRILSEKELADCIRELPQRPLFIGVNGIRLSLSGVQDKAAVIVTPEGIGIPASGPTTHILKPDLTGTPGVVYCEYLCMQAASRIGLNAAPVSLGKAEDLTYLLVKRFDRQTTDVGKVLRIHQEDFCQALAIPSKRKYQNEGGPTLKDCFSLLAKTAVPAKERINLLNLIVFNFLIGNMDAHGKNFSLFHSSKGIRLAPAYDVLCTTAFPDYEKALAMTIGDYYEPEEIYAHNWRTFCEDIEFSFPKFKSTSRALYSTLPKVIDSEYRKMQSEGWSHPACERAVALIKANCSELQARLNA